MAQGSYPLANTVSSQVPAHLVGRPKRGLVADALQGLGGNNPPHVSIKQNRFRLVNAAGQEWLLDTFHMDVVVIDVNPNVSKIYYADAFDPMATEFKPPTCFSDNGPETTGVAQTPSQQAQFPQSPTCQLCPQNQWGSETSRISGKAIKACNDLKKIAVIVPMDPTRGVYLLRVPPASLKNFRNYGKQVDEQGVDLPDMITRLTFDPQVQGVLNFQPVGWIDEPTVQFIDSILESKITEGLVGKTDRPRNDVPAIAAQAGPAPAQLAYAPPQPPQQGMQQMSQPITPQQFAPPQQEANLLHPTFTSPTPAGLPIGFGSPQQGGPAPTPISQQMPPPAAPASFMQPAVPAAPAKARKPRRTKAEIAAERAGPQAAAPAPQATVPAFMQAPQAAPAFVLPQQAPVPGYVAPVPTTTAAPPLPEAAPGFGDPLAIPAFLQRNPQPEAPKPVFGMQQPEAAPDNITAQLDKAFALPT